MASVADEIEGRRSPSPPPPRRSASPVRWVYAGYYIAQALVGIALWSVAMTVPMVRSWLDIVPEHRGFVDAFLYPDIAVIVVASILSAWGVAVGARWAPAPAAFTAGAVLYPTLYLVGWVSLTGGAGASALAIMVPPAMLSALIALQVWWQS